MRSLILKYMVSLVVLQSISFGSWLIPTKKSNKNRFTKIQIARFVAVNVGVGLVAGIVTRKITSQNGIKEVTIFGPGKISVGAPK